MTAARGRTTTNAVSRARPAAQLRLNESLELRMTGATWQEVADACGWTSRTSAHRAVSKELMRRTAEVDHTGALQLELERLDALQAAHWPAAVGAGRDDGGLDRRDDDGLDRGGLDDAGVGWHPGPDEKAASVVLRVMDRRAKYLGLDDSERRLADAVEGVAGSVAVTADVVQAVLMAVLGRLDLTDEQAGTVPAIVVSVLEQHPALLSS